MAIVTHSFKGVPDGEVHVKDFAPGDTVTGDLARVALAENWATDAERSAAGQKGRKGASSSKASTGSDAA
ncbi:MAG: hypothetical protein INF91_04875 [Alphaproteobacteria bacterium]|nr:hypothetical protein [Alphaproteobacteria bacterium]